VSVPLATIRRALFWMFIAGALGIAAELVLSRHYEDFWQWVPLGLLAASLPLALACRGSGLRPIQAFRVLMVLFAASGIIGTLQHYGAKQEFVLERLPDMRGLALLQETLKGINPPLLAPGAMLLLAAIGLVWTYALAAQRDDTSLSAR
jgi:hypothetical protein